MKLTKSYLKKLIEEQLLKENAGDVTYATKWGSSYVSHNGEIVLSDKLASAFGDQGLKLLKMAQERVGGDHVEPDAFIEYYLAPTFKVDIEQIAQKYAQHVGANYAGQESSGEESEEY